MKPLYIFGDTHLGSEVTGGTTPATKHRLRKNLLSDFEGLLAKASGSLLINGDLYDTDKIALDDLLESYLMLSSWLSKNDKLYLSQGNHCAAGNSEKTSSFDMLCGLLQAAHGDKAVPIYGSLYLPEHDAYVIASLRNQDAFQQALSEVPPCKVVYLHCNYNSPYTQDSLHSLNLTEQVARTLPVEKVVMSHEHVRREALGGKVQLIGCPFPARVADCISGKDKFMVCVTGSEIEYIETWQAAGDFVQLDWRNLQDDGARFIRVIGQATAAEASEVVSAISKFRSKSDALVISNAVSVEGVSDQDELDLSVEQMAAFDVRAALYEILSKDEVAVVSKLLEGENV